eukprot:IDg14361t1
MRIYRSGYARESHNHSSTCDIMQRARRSSRRGSYSPRAPSFLEWSSSARRLFVAPIRAKKLDSSVLLRVKTSAPHLEILPVPHGPRNKPRPKFRKKSQIYTDASAVVLACVSRYGARKR